MSWKIYYWSNNSGRSPAKEFIDALPSEARVKVRNLYRLIIEFGPCLGLPHMKYIAGYQSLIEFRIVGTNSIRLLGWIDKNSIIIAHVFRKKTQKIPKHELETAFRRLRNG